MPQSTEDAVAAVEQRRIDALITSDIDALDAIIDEHCTHIESNGTSRTKAAFLADVAKREFSFDLLRLKRTTFASSEILPSWLGPIVISFGCMGIPTP